MSNKTPKRNSICNQNVVGGFSQIKLPVSPAAVSPQRNLTGLPRVTRDLVADLYNNIQKWNDLHVKGAALVKQIAILKSENFNSFPLELERYVNDLFLVTESLKVNRGIFVHVAKQIKALTKLGNNNKPIFISLRADQLSELFEKISEAYLAEFETKQFVLENIAYCTNKDDIMFFAANWTYQIHITNNINLKLETLLVETGHHRYT